MITKGEKVKGERGIWKNGAGSGYVAEIWVTVDGARRVFRSVENSLDGCRDFRAQVRLDAKGGLIERAARVRFEEFVNEDYFPAWSRGRKPSTVKQERLRLDGMILPVLGDLWLDRITRRHVERYLTGRSATVGPASQNRELCRIKNALGYAVKLGLLKDNPASGIKQIPEPMKERPILNREQIAGLLATATGYLRGMVLVAVTTGMRFGEIAGLRWTDVDLDSREIVVRDTKNREDRRVPIAGGLVESLRGTDRVSDYVFPSPKTGGKIGSIKTAWGTLRDRVNADEDLPDLPGGFRFNDLRHTANSLLAMNGVDAHARMRIVGHKSPRMQSRYTHFESGHIRDAIEGTFDSIGG